MSLAGRHLSHRVAAEYGTGGRFGWQSASRDKRSLGELFLYFSDEMADITWIQAFQMLLQMFRSILKDNTELAEEKINELVDAFMNTLPVVLKTKLQAA